MPTNLEKLLTSKIATADLNLRYARSAVSAGDTEDVLRCLAMLAQTVESATDTAAKRARQQGATWQQIGDLLGVTRQGAQQRYGD